MVEPGEDERQVIRRLVWSGFTAPSEAEEIVEDFLVDEPDLDVSAVQAVIDEEFASKAAAEATWPTVTDCDRLDAAFEALETQGVLGLHNAGFTMADGHVEAAEALACAPEHRFFGYCFYHEQDVERAIEGHPLWIAFDHVKGGAPEKEQVARAVIAALANAGLRPVWNDEPQRRIVLEGFIWRRRLERAAEPAR